MQIVADLKNLVTPTRRWRRVGGRFEEKFIVIPSAFSSSRKPRLAVSLMAQAIFGATTEEEEEKPFANFVIVGDSFSGERRWRRPTVFSAIILGETLSPADFKNLGFQRLIVMHDPVLVINHPHRLCLYLDRYGSLHLQAMEVEARVDPLKDGRVFVE